MIIIFSSLLIQQTKRKKKRERIIPVQLKPSPSYPSLHVQLAPPMKDTHVAST